MSRSYKEDFMDFENLINAFIPYGLPSLIIGVATGVAFYFTDLVLSKNLKSVNPYLPLGVSFALTLVYALIFSPTQTFSEQTVSAGLLSGSLSVAIFVFIKNLKNGNADFNAIKTVISCYLDEDQAKKLYKKLLAEIKKGGDDLDERIKNLLESQDVSKETIKELLASLTENAKNKDKK